MDFHYVFGSITPLSLNHKRGRGLSQVVTTPPGRDDHIGSVVDAEDRVARDDFKQTDLHVLRWS